MRRGLAGIAVGIITVCLGGCPAQEAEKTEAADTPPPRDDYADKTLEDWIADLRKDGDHHRPARIKASRALIKNHEQSVPALAKLLKDPDPNVRDRAVYVLQRMGPKAKPAVHDIIAVLQRPDEELYVRHRAATALEAIHSPEAGPALVEAMRSDDPKLRQLATGALGRCRYAEQDAIDGLIKALEDPVSKVRVAAALSLNTIGPKATEAFEPLLACLADPGLQNAVGLAVGNVATKPEQIEKLVQCLDDRDPLMRRGAATALYRMGGRGKPGLEKLELLAEQDPDANVRQVAKLAVGHIKKAERRQR